MLQGFFKTIMAIAATTLLMLPLAGCSSSHSDSTPATKIVSGAVMDTTSGGPVVNSVVSVYAINADGSVATAPLSIPATTRSGADGSYSIGIPLDYSGPFVVQAAVSPSQAPGTALTTLRAAVATQTGDHTVVMLNLATELTARYVEINCAGLFSAANIRLATIMLTPFMGEAFASVGPTLSAAPVVQQQLLVTSAALNELVSSGASFNQLITVNPATGMMAMGEGQTLTDLNQAAQEQRDSMVSSGILPATFTVLPYTPVATTTIDPTDASAPAAPTGLAAAVTGGGVSLTWAVPSSSYGITGYHLYRNGVLYALLPASPASYSDSGVLAATGYLYELRAHDSNGNISTGTTVSATTGQLQTYTISGRIVAAGSSTGIAGINVVLSGFGSGVGVTDADGNYIFNGARSGSYTVRPVPTTHTFTPAGRTVTVASANVGGVNFTAQVGGTISGGVTFPPGTIIGGISYPNSTVSGGITYTTTTVIGGISYPTGTVIGGVSYPNGVIIGGVQYPPGTIVSGVAFPPGAVTAGFVIPTSELIGALGYPTGVVGAQVVYPTGSITGDFNYNDIL